MNNFFSKLKTNILILLMVLGCYNIDAQIEKPEKRIVLKTDSLKLFGVNYPAAEFSHSYFIVQAEYDKTFTEEDFVKFQFKLKNINSEISALKALNNSQIAVIFSKMAASSIDDYSGLIKSNFPEIANYNVLSFKIKHIQVVNEFDPKNKQSEKGFN